MNEGGDSAPALQALRPSRADEQGLSLPYSPSSATLPPPSGSLTGCVWNVMAAMMEQLQRAVEPVLESTFTKRRRQDFLASAGPTLLCLTFVEDALRVLMRWSEQMQFMTKTMKRCERPARRTYADVGLGWFIAVLLLLISMLTQFAGSVMILRPSHYKPSRVKLGCYLLLSFVFIQPFMYGQATDMVCAQTAAPWANYYAVTSPPCPLCAKTSPL
eukprot:scaffold10881_cov35-Tisochrysis_lutea.AAC.4